MSCPQHTPTPASAPPVQAGPESPAMHPRLFRLDALTAALARSGDVAAVLGLGSAGVEHDRFDDHSDIDFFVIVDDVAAKARYLSDIEWLAAMGTVVYEFANDANGRKALFDHGLFIEYAVFTVAELPGLSWSGARVIWQRTPLELAAGAPPTPAASIDTVAFHLGEALTNLFVGVHRELRGERLTASRFIQVFAVDRVLALARLTGPDRPGQRDPYDSTRRCEAAYPELAAQLRGMVTGYRGNVRAAHAVLAWLTSRFATDPVITGAISTLLDQAEAAAGCPDRRSGRSASRA